MTKIIFLVVLIFVSKISGQILNCRYLEDLTYTCKLDIIIINYQINSTKLSGVHLDDKTDDDVVAVKSTFGTFSGFFPSTICEKFKNLKVLDLKDMNIEMIQNNSFDGCANLEKLLINFVINTELPENLFNANTKLSSLLIHAGSLQSFPKNLLKKNGKLLRELEIHVNSRNCLLPWEFFNSLESLQTLIMELKGLKVLDQDWFKISTKLEEIAIVHSEISFLPKNIFSYLKNLRKLSLQFNSLTVIHSDSLTGLNNLNYLDLQFNKIYSFDPNILKLKNLRFINFVSNFCDQGSVIDSSENVTSMQFLSNQCTKNFTLQGTF